MKPRIYNFFNRYDYFFFDFDGVILDSVRIKTEAFKELYSEFGDAIVKKVISHHQANGGLSRFKKFRIYHEKFLSRRLSKKEVDALSRRFSAIALKKVLRAAFIEGALIFLKDCKKRKKKCFVVSGTPDPEIKTIIRRRRLSRFFLAVCGSPTEKKTHVRRLIKKYGIHAKSAVFFGDSKNDYGAARNNRINFIGINYNRAATNFKNFKHLYKQFSSGSKG